MKKIVSILLSVMIAISSFIVFEISANAEFSNDTKGLNDDIYLFYDDVIEFNGHFYKVFPNDTVSTWEDARYYCESIGGYLAVISSNEENSFLFNYLTTMGIQSAYFGFSDAKFEGKWEWVENEKSIFTNWEWGEPNCENNEEDYAGFYWKFTEGTWNDGNFSNGTYEDGTAFICEWGWNASLGDVNRDGIFDITDIVISRAYIVGSIDLGLEQIAIGDMNGDSVLDIIDVVMMRKAIVG